MQPSLLLAVLPAFVVGGNSDVTGLDVTQATAPAEQGVTWKDLFKSGSRVQFYGFLRLDAYYNTARMNNIILPFTVSPEDGSTVADDDAGFAFDPRLTRIGMDVKVGEVEGTKVNGKLEVDFANFPAGVPESRPAPRIRLAYVDLAGEEFGLRVGQQQGTRSESISKSLPRAGRSWSSSTSPRAPGSRRWMSPSLTRPGSDRRAPMASR
jgi:hypothetical protein